MVKVVSIALIIAGVIHVLPLAGVLGADQLSALYGVEIDDPNLVILMQHRAVLFALLGALLITSAFVPALRTLAIPAGLISTISFLALAFLSGSYNERVSTVVTADIVALVCLIIAGAVTRQMEGG